MQRGSASDLSGLIFGRLTAVERAGSDQTRAALWRCTCTCGGELVTRGRSLREGLVVSCGCRKREQVSRFHRSNVRHGFARTGAKASEYTIWCSIKARCYNEKHVRWKDYGGRGIGMCDRWRRSFLAFYEDTGPRPPGRSIDRINNDGNYEPGNCRWADAKTQRSNQRRRCA